MGRVWTSSCGKMQLREGRWQTVLADVTECDAVVTDPPYSARLHSGFRSAKDFEAEKVARTRFGSSGSLAYGGIPYEPISDEAAGQLTKMMSPLWWVIFGDHGSFRIWENALDLAGWYAFAPVIWIRAENEPRFQGDGPACTCEHICVARRKQRVTCGSLRGHYDAKKLHGAHPEKLLKGQKPLALMQEIIRDYSNPGDLVVDPFAGSGTTLLAAAIEGRRAIGAECDPETYAKAVKRLSAGYTPAMSFAKPPKQRQGTLI